MTANEIFKPFEQVVIELRAYWKQAQDALSAMYELAETQGFSVEDLHTISYAKMHIGATLSFSATPSNPWGRLRLLEERLDFYARAERHPRPQDAHWILCPKKFAEDHKFWFLPRRTGISPEQGRLLLASTFRLIDGHELVYAIQDPRS